MNWSYRMTHSWSINFRSKTRIQLNVCCVIQLVYMSWTHDMLNQSSKLVIDWWVNRMSCFRLQRRESVGWALILIDEKYSMSYIWKSHYILWSTYDLHMNHLYYRFCRYFSNLTNFSIQPTFEFFNINHILIILIAWKPIGHADESHDLLTVYSNIRVVIWSHTN